MWLQVGVAVNAMHSKGVSIITVGVGYFGGCVCSIMEAWLHDALCPIVEQACKQDSNEGSIAWYNCHLLNEAVVRYIMRPIRIVSGRTQLFIVSRLPDVIIFWVSIFVLGYQYA